MFDRINALMWDVADRAARSSWGQRSATLMVAVMTSVAHAQGTPAASTGVSGIFSNLGNAAKSFINIATIVAVAIGVAAVLYGIVMMIKKGMGRGDDIEWRQIIWPLVGGALATVVMFVVRALVVEAGASADQMGESWSKNK